MVIEQFLKFENPLIKQTSKNLQDFIRIGGPFESLYLEKMYTAYSNYYYYIVYSMCCYIFLNKALYF